LTVTTFISQGSAVRQQIWGRA